MEPWDRYSRLPKAHLHMHLEGCFPLGLLRAAPRVPSGRPPKYDSPQRFYSLYTALADSVESLAELSALCAGIVREEAIDGSCYIEPAVEPYLYSPRLGTPEGILAAMVEGFLDGQEATGVTVGVMIGANTDLDSDLSRAMAELAVRWSGRGVVAFGTAGFLPGRLGLVRRSIEMARDAGLAIVCHAGELGGPDGIWQALDVARPTRLAHGVAAAQDSRLMATLAERGIVCDVCPTSNVSLGVVPDYGAHPLGEMLAAGVPVTINADDALLFRTRIALEYALAHERMGISAATLREVARTSVEASALPVAERRRALEGIDAWPARGDSGRDAGI